jgi:DNA replication protein DnaC
VGKSHVAQSLGHLAIPHGADARFLKTSRALAHLAGGHADHTCNKRLGELARPAVLILNFAMRELTPAQADDLYELITERAGRSLILTSNRAPQDWYRCSPTPLSPSPSWTADRTETRVASCARAGSGRPADSGTS